MSNDLSHAGRTYTNFPAHFIQHFKFPACAGNMFPTHAGTMVLAHFKVYEGFY